MKPILSVSRGFELPPCPGPESFSDGKAESEISAESQFDENSLQEIEGVIAAMGFSVSGEKRKNRGMLNRQVR